MKKIAVTLAALSLSAGVAFADNPYVGRTDVIQSGPNAGQPIWDENVTDIDRGTTASIDNMNAETVPNTTQEELADPSANRYGDAEPGSDTFD